MIDLYCGIAEDFEKAGVGWGASAAAHPLVESFLHFGFIKLEQQYFCIFGFFISLPMVQQ